MQKVEQSKSNKLFYDAISAKLILDDDKDDQDILDQHVSRVWADRTPHRSPGNLSPGNPLLQRRKPYDIHIMGGGSKLSIHSHFYIIYSKTKLFKGIQSKQESNIRKFSKWGSVNTDRFAFCLNFYIKSF